MNLSLDYDAVVIGAGTAGLVAATRLAQAGINVCVLAKGIGSTHLAPGTIDVLGYGPEPIDSPREGLAALLSARPDHPYGLIGIDLVSEALDWFVTTAAAGPFDGYSYIGGIERNLLLPNPLGVLRRSALVPATMAAGERGQLRRVCIVGTPSLRDFQASLCAANLQMAGIEARAISLELELEYPDVNALGVARHLDDERWRGRFCARLAPLLQPGEHVGLPAILGVIDPHRVMNDLEQRLERRVFEIPTLPPSVPGIRLYEILRSALRQAGGRLVLGAEVVSHTRSGERIASVSTRASGHYVSYRADWFVLASGGFASGAIALDSHWVTSERVLNLALEGIPAADEPRFRSSYLDQQPLSRAGVAVDRGLRARGLENVMVAGAALPGAAPAREGSGEGLALSSGYLAAETISATQDPRKKALT